MAVKAWNGLFYGLEKFSLSGQAAGEFHILTPSGGSEKTLSLSGRKERTGRTQRLNTDLDSQPLTLWIKSHHKMGLPIELPAILIDLKETLHRHAFSTHSSQYCLNTLPGGLRDLQTLFGQYVCQAVSVLVEENNLITIPTGLEKTVV